MKTDFRFLWQLWFKTKPSGREDLCELDLARRNPWFRTPSHTTWCKNHPYTVGYRAYKVCARVLHLGGHTFWKLIQSKPNITVLVILKEKHSLTNYFVQFWSFFSDIGCVELTRDYLSFLSFSLSFLVTILIIHHHQWHRLFRVYQRLIVFTFFFSFCIGYNFDHSSVT